MNKTEIYIGLDVHEETITAAIAEGGRTGEVRQAGTITNDMHAVEKLLRRIRGDQARTLHVCYEAGPCGFVIARRCKQLGIDCTVVAPSLIPKKPGDKIKTDRRDAEKLARLLRAGDLSPVYVPEATDEASRGEFKKCGGTGNDAKAHEYQHTNRREPNHPARSSASHLLSLPAAKECYEKTIRRIILPVDKTAAISTSLVRYRWLGLWIEEIGSEGTRPALLPAGPVPERWNVKLVFIETPDGPAINWTSPLDIFVLLYAGEAT